MLNTLKKWVPITYDAFMEYEYGGARLSATALKVVKNLIAGKKITQKNSGLSLREWAEVMETLEQNKND